MLEWGTQKQTLNSSSGQDGHTADAWHACSQAASVHAARGHAPCSTLYAGCCSQHVVYTQSVCVNQPRAPAAVDNNAMNALTIMHMQHLPPSP